MENQPPTPPPADLNHGVIRTDWHHAPPHWEVPDACYMVTGGCFRRQHFLDTPARRTRFLELLLHDCAHCGWQLHAWAIMSNHYHFIATNNGATHTMRTMINHLHSAASQLQNKEDGTPKRKVWNQMWDTCLTFESSYYARLHYVLRNPVKHGLVEDASKYEWCSMKQFQENATSSFCKKVQSYRCDNISFADKDEDNFTPQR